MTKWKLCRQSHGSEEFILTEGDEVTIGRSLTNTITLSSFVISRNHCVLTVHKNKVLITDLKSSNGVYVGLAKIPQNKPYTLRDSDIVGIGWIAGAPLADINNEEKFVFKLCKENGATSLSNRIQFQNENDIDEIEEHVAALHCDQENNPNKQSPIFNPKLSLKRKADIIKEIKVEIKAEKKCRINTDNDVVILLSDSENELQKKETENIIKLEPIGEEPIESMKDKIKCENDFNEYDVFEVKQEYVGYDDEPIKVDSDSDSESENWFLRLSQSSPGKPFIRKSHEKIDAKPDDSSYSQMDDDYISFGENLEEDYLDDLITIPPDPSEQTSQVNEAKSDEDFEDIICLDRKPTAEPIVELDIDKDEVDAFNTNHVSKEIEEIAKTPVVEPQNAIGKTIQMIEPQAHKSKIKHDSGDKKSKSSSKHSKVKKHSNRRHISNSQKEERKKKLREIATKGKECDPNTNNSSNSSKISATNINKITSSNRGGFLTDSVQVVKPVTRKEESKEHKSKHKSSASLPKPQSHNKQGDSNSTTDVENRKKLTDLSIKNDEYKSTKSKHDTSKSHIKSNELSKTNDVREPLKSLKPEIERDGTSKSKSSHNNSQESSKVQEVRPPLKSVKPLSESETYSGKPFSIVEPLPPKKVKKTVRFSDAGPEVHIFEIEPGNKMKKTSLVKMSLVDTRKMSVFSLEKITLMKILRWNPHWLEEQRKNDDPPPILGHNNPPMATFHSYVNHNQYVQLVGDLLLMEIWECLSIAYDKIRNQSIGLQMRIGSLPPVPTQERCYELFSLSVNISLPSNGPKYNVPRVGEIILATFGPDNAKTQRFFFVHNVRLLPSPPNNIHSFYCISLHATFTDKMRTLRQGEMIIGVPLAYINKELNLFEAMEYLAGSPLSEAILRPEPRHFQRSYVPGNEIISQWTKTLNPSQQVAVTSSVSAALGDKPSIQMVQGPPGTGKSSVICSMVMTYFYNEHGRRQQNRGKVLICATSNAAVDELVIRLLKIRQSLPKTERFRMVRVGRAEAMHSRARDVSSQQLAQRDATRLLAEPASHPALQEEISHLEAKINMWKTATQDAKDPVRVAYCQGRVSDLVKRITLVKSGGGVGGSEELRPDRLVAAEKRIIEGADIVVTTLASAQNHKMKGLKRRIALCIIDEAGQAIEPETLIPLTLDVTRLTLIGDPQQLPGYICSQKQLDAQNRVESMDLSVQFMDTENNDGDWHFRAKKHGLGESLFSRLTSSTEQWPEGSPVVLLNQQYRMHPDIADYPNRAFYGGQVHSTAPQRPLNLVVPPYAILSISSGDKGQGSSGANEMEAWGVSRLVTALNATLRSQALNLAVITPYNAHKELIKKHLRTLQDPSEPPIEVNTVDSFQGQERDVVVVSLARSQGVGFLTDAGRMNVMLTRAKHALLICLNPHAILKNHQWRTLVEDAQRRNMYKMLPIQMCQPTTAAAMPHDDILRYISNK